MSPSRAPRPGLEQQLSSQGAEREQRYINHLRLVLDIKKDHLQLGFSNPMLINKITHFAQTHTHTHTNKPRQIKTVYSRKREQLVKNVTYVRKNNRILFIRRKEKTKKIGRAHV